MRLAEELDGAKYVQHIPHYGMVAAWFGGHGIHFYTYEGEEVHFENTGSFERNHATRQEVIESIDRWICENDMSGP